MSHTIQVVEENARAAYIANSQFVSDNVGSMGISLCTAFAKEQDRLHLIIQEEEKKRLNINS